MLILNVTAVVWLKRNQFFIIFLLEPVKCSELAEPIATSCAKAYNPRLHWWQVAGYLC